MPVNKGKSSFAAKMGTAGKKAVESHREDDTQFDQGGDLPAGIMGVAQLREIKFDQFKDGDNKGQYYFYAAGVVVKPAEHEGIPIFGLRTSIMERLHDTPPRKGEKKREKGRYTVDDHLSWVMNELRKLGVDTSDLSIDDLEGIAATLAEEQPYFRFRTWIGKATKDFPNPRTQHSWNGIAEGFDPEAEDDGMGDNEDEDEEDEEDEDADTDEDGDGDDGDDGDDTDAEEEGEEEEDLKALGVAGDKKKDKKAQSRLDELAKEVGLKSVDYETWVELAEAIEAAREEAGEDEEDSEADDESDEEEKDWAAIGKVADTPEGDDELAELMEEAKSRGIDLDDYETVSWQKLGKLMNEGLGLEDAEEEGEEEEEEEGEELEPSKGEVYAYKPPKKTKTAQCSVLAVNKPKRTVKLKNLDDGKSIYSDVSWDELQEGN